LATKSQRKRKRNIQREKGGGRKKRGRGLKRAQFVSNEGLLV
jgi:hypothetical protein